VPTQNAKSLVAQLVNQLGISGQMAKLLNMGRTFARVSRTGPQSKAQLSANNNYTLFDQGPLLAYLGTTTYF